MLSHFARDMAEDDMPILKFDIKLCTGERLNDDAGEFNNLFALWRLALLGAALDVRGWSACSLGFRHKLQ